MYFTLYALAQGFATYGPQVSLIRPLQLFCAKKVIINFSHFICIFFENF